MGLFDRFRKKIDKPVTPLEKSVKKTKSAREPVTATKSAKDMATERDEPYVAVISMDVDPTNINTGAFELDWNEKFIANLLRAGYQGRTDSDLVDQWFQNVCRNVVMETYEQDQAMDNASRYTQSRDIGDGRREVS